MYIKKMSGYLIGDKLTFCKSNKKTINFQPDMFESVNFNNWITVLDLKTCLICRSLHGKIYYKNEVADVLPPVHNNCRCEIVPLLSVEAGKSTLDGVSGADWWIKYYGVLPDNYLTKYDAKKLGWVNALGNLSSVAPDKSIGGDIYRNRNGHLPNNIGRVWREADINYAGGYRGSSRIIYSNDGLIFVTYAHYRTFVEII